MMEDYDKFVQVCLSQLRENKEEEKQSRPLSSSSVICFYGRAILPPLLSGKQKEEMQRHREEVQKAAHKRLKDDPRMAYVQTILHSVQLRNTLTLEELLQETETEIRTELSRPHNTNKDLVSHSDGFIGTMDSLSSGSVKTLKNDSFLPPKTSTTYSAFFSPKMSPQQSYHEGCLSDQSDSQQESQPCSFNGESHQSPSSGYVTNENPENITSISGRNFSGTKECDFSFSREIDDMSGFFLHNTSNTIVKMPDIISHPPIDGEELERSGLELTFCSNLLEVKDICETSFHSNLATCDPLQAEQSEISHLSHSMEHEGNVPFTTKHPFNNINMDGNKGVVALTDNSDFLDNPDVSQTLSNCPTPELHFQEAPSEAKPELVDNQINITDTNPHPMSLQALLKKSQEYRRRQRMLRNQAKSTKIQERTQEQPKARTEEQNLSDKENDDKGTVTTEGRKTKERRGAFIPSVENKMMESEMTVEKTNFKTEGVNVTQDEQNKELMSAEEETTLKNQLNSSQEFITQSKQSRDLIQQLPTSAETSFQKNIDGPKCPEDFSKEERKYGMFPIPNFCQSPVRCKSIVSPKDRLTAEETGTLFKGCDLNQVRVQNVNLKPLDSLTEVLSTVNLMNEDDAMSVFTKNSLHIDQLESNLSSLKGLISDLESTVKENSQTESDMQSESSFKGIKHSELIQNDQHAQLSQKDSFGFLEDKQGVDNDGRELQRKSFKNIHEDLEPKPSFIELNDIHLTVYERAPETVKLSQQSMLKTTAIRRENGKEMCVKKIAKSDAQHAASSKQQFPAKCLTSVAQRRKIPTIFRNVPYENFPSSDVSALSDQSNNPELREREVTAEGQSSVCSPSLNQSYDVETPSGLWLLEGSGSDLGSQSHLGQEKYLTPESGGEEQGGVSKVKRRLLMHVTEGTQESSADPSRPAGSVVRPNSSTPTAAVHWYEGHQRDKRKQLKQVHAAQIRALQDEHRKQQEELLQALAARYHLLQNVSPCSMSGSRPGDTLTFSTLSQPLSPLSQHYRPLLAAAVKGFLTRRLLRTERVSQLVCTIRDTQQFLQASQQQDASRGEFCSRQDVLLQERVALQLRAAHYEVYDIFFSLSARERMQLISWDRELARERQLRQQNGHAGYPRRRSFLSAATQKSLERKREMMIQKKATGQHRGVTTKTGQKSGFTADKPQGTKRGQFKANPQRVPKSAYSSKPQ